MTLLVQTLVSSGKSLHANQNIKIKIPPCGIFLLLLIVQENGGVTVPLLWRGGFFVERSETKKTGWFI